MNRLGVVAATSAAIVSVVIPFWLAIIPPMTDVSHHILVTYIVREFNNPELRFADFFLLDWTGAPTDLFYAAFRGLQSMVGPFVDVKLYLTIWAVSLWAAVTYLARAFSTEHAWLAGVLALPLGFSWYVYMGFLPFLLSMPLFALALGVWFRPIRTTLKVPLLWVILVCLFGAHVVGAAAAVAVMGLSTLPELIAKPSERLSVLVRLAVTVLPVPLMLFRYLSGENAPSVQADPFDLARNVRNVVHYTAASLIRPSLYVMIAWILGVGLLALRSLRERKFPTSLWLSALALTLLAIVMPSSLGALWPAGPRLLPFVLILLCVGATISVPRRVAIASSAVGFLVILATLTTQSVRELNTDMREYLSGAAHVRKGSKILPIVLDPSVGSRDVDPFWSIASAYVLERGGAHPYVFARPYIKTGASPLQYRQRSSFTYDFLFKPEKKAADYAGVSCCYDYVVLWGTNDELRTTLSKEMDPVYQTDRLVVFEARR